MSQDLQSEAGAFFLGASLPGLLGVFIDGSQDPKQYQLVVEQVLDRFRKTSQNDIHTMAYWARGIELCLEHISSVNQRELRYIVSGTHPEMTDKVDDTTRQEYEGDRWRLFCSLRPGMAELAYILERIENTDVMAYCAYVLASYASLSPSEDDISLAKSLRVRFGKSWNAKEQVAISLLGGLDEIPSPRRFSPVQYAIDAPLVPENSGISGDSVQLFNGDAPENPEARAFFLGQSLPGLLGVCLNGSVESKRYQLAVEQFLDRLRKTSQNDIHTMAYWARGIELCLEYRSSANQMHFRYIASGAHPKLTEKVDDTTRQKYEGDRWRLFCSMRPGMTELAYILERIENIDVMAYCAFELASYASLSPSEDDISLAKSLRVRFGKSWNSKEQDAIFLGGLDEIPSPDRFSPVQYAIDAPLVPENSGNSGDSVQPFNGDAPENPEAQAGEPQADDESE